MNMTRPSAKISGGLSWQELARRLAMPVSWIAGTGIIAAILVGSQTGLADSHQLILTGLALVPALLHLVLFRFRGEEWAEAMILVGWTALALAGMAMAGNLYSPLLSLSILPVLAGLSMNRMNRVLEASVLASLAIIAVAVAGPMGWLARDGFLLSAWPQMEMSVLIMVMFVAITGTGSVLPSWDEEARVRDALFRNGAHVDFCMGADGFVVTASNLARRWSRGARNIKQIALDPHALSVLQQGLRDAIEYGVSMEVQLPLGANGHLHHVHLRPLDPRQAVLSIEDISTQESLIARLRTERDAAVVRAQEKAMFLASMSHELRTPLNAIVGFSDMMKARLYGPIPAKYAEYADLIHESGQHLVDLVGDVLDISKIDSDRYELVKDDFDINEIIRSCVKLMQMSAESAGVELETQVPDLALPVHADRKAMRQILFNLISNAIKFTPHGGKIIVAAEINGDGYMTLSVSDNGMGMSAEDAARVGQPFTQAESARVSDARGSGLGLSLVKALSELHGGSFRLHSQLENGTEVQLALPIVDVVLLDRGKVEKLDVRAHIRRAQKATQEIAAVSGRIAGGK